MLVVVSFNTTQTEYMLTWQLSWIYHRLCFGCTETTFIVWWQVLGSHFVQFILERFETYDIRFINFHIKL